MKIQNAQELAQTPLRTSALQILEAGLQAIDTETVIQKGIQFKNETLYVRDKAFPIAKTGRLALVAIGKSAIHASSALEKILGARLHGGIAFDTQEHPEYPLYKIQRCVGTHPAPTEKNAEWSRHLVSFLEQFTEQDLMLFLVSGGGSTLLCLPHGNATCANEALILKALFEAGATIQEINTVRKHISYARGGFLAKHAYPAQVVSLIFSDVPGNDLGFVASGPTVQDITTVADAKKVLQKHHIPEIPLSETPKDEQYFLRVANILFLSNDTALKAMAEKARELGFGAKIQSNQLTGEAKEQGSNIAQAITKTLPGTAHIYGGETTVKMRNGGKGGRNQELALGAIHAVEQGMVVAAINSDGWDNTDHAGAMCDILTKEKAQKLGLDPVLFLQKHASYDFFEQTKDYITTGHTGSNVSDLVVALKA